jgi:phage terminase large subunit
MDDTYRRFIKDTPEDCTLAKVNYWDNPWFPVELQKEMEECKRTNLKKYLHIWEGECANDYDDSIIQPEWVEAAINAHKVLTERGQQWEAAGIRSLGFDPADEGTDAKAVAFRHGTIVNNVKQWDGGDIDDAINTAFSYADDWRADLFGYDSIGIGASIKVGLEKRIAGKKIDVWGFCGSEKVSDPNQVYEGDRKNKDVFRNKRAQWWWFLRDRFEKTYRAVVKGEYINPEELISLSGDIEDLGQLKSELSRVQRKRGTNNSLILLESKPEMMKRGAKSPNMADALVMCFANPPPRVVAKELSFAKRW